MKNYKGFTLHLFISNTTKLSKKIKSIFNHRKGEGFTLVEILVVIAVIGLLASIIVISLGSVRDKAKIAKGLQFEANIHHALGANAIGIWDFDEGTGLTVTDSSGYNNNGTIINGAAWSAVGETPSGKGYALNFDGDNDHVRIPAQPYFTEAPLTISVWVRFDQLPSDKGELETIVTKKHGSNPWASWSLRGEIGNDKFSLKVVNSAASSTWTYSDSAIIVDTWYHVVGIIDESYNTTMYVNGAKQSDTDSPGSLYNATGILHIGADWSGGDRMKGSIDEVRIYQKALNSAQIKQLYVEGLKKHNLVNR